MLWEELTAKCFPGCIRDSGAVCILPIGVLEKHGNHLPVGTDMYIGTAVSRRAAEMETSIVFPYYFLGQISEARHYTGTIAPSHQLMMDALLEMCDEIHRNGFTKIILASSHGGNRHFIPFFVEQMLKLGRTYNIYIAYIPGLKEAQRSVICDIAKTDDLGAHAGLKETSLIMYLRPELVEMDAQYLHECHSLDRLAHLQEKRISTGFDWYSQYPYHIAGDPSRSSAELGRMIFDMMCENLAEVIRAVKADNELEKLRSEFRLLGEKPQARANATVTVTGCGTIC
jgi:creatinine amidohydrolase